MVAVERFPVRRRVTTAVGCRHPMAVCREPPQKEETAATDLPEAAAAEAAPRRLEEPDPERTERLQEAMEVDAEEPAAPAADRDIQEEPAAMEVRAAADAGRPAAKRAITFLGIRM